MDEAVNKILTADQHKRLKEIQIQLAGNLAATDKDVQKSLALTDDQRASIKRLQQQAQQANRSVFDKMRDGEIDRTTVGTSIKHNRDALNTEIGKILTDDQKAKLKAMSGKTFKQSVNQGGGQ